MFRLPARDSRTTIIGGTGSGKTLFAGFLLSRADLSARPWVALDYKRDPLFDRLLRDRVAPLATVGRRWGRRERGLSIIRPRLEEDDEAIDALFRHLLRRGRVGLWIDELYSVPNGAPLNSLYYQGRSKSIQIIACCQRPVSVTRFAISEASNFALFGLRDRDDAKRVKGFVPAELDVEARLPRYHCLWYDAAQDYHCILSPAPNAAITIDAIAAAQPRKFW